MVQPLPPWRLINIVTVIPSPPLTTSAYFTCVEPRFSKVHFVCRWIMKWVLLYTLKTTLSVREPDENSLASIPLLKINFHSILYCFAGDDTSLPVSVCDTIFLHCMKREIRTGVMCYSIGRPDLGPTVIKSHWASELHSTKSTASCSKRKESKRTPPLCIWSNSDANVEYMAATHMEHCLPRAVHTLARYPFNSMTADWDTNSESLQD